MSRVAANRLMPSILDRLIDPESMGGGVAGYGFKQMINSVRVDLEDLLNTRRSCGVLDPSFEELETSIVAYGLPELNEYNGTSPEQVQKLERAIVQIINRFEPRLRRVRARVILGKDHGAIAVNFHIDAELNVDPAPEVGFETILELTTGKARVTAKEAGQ